MKNSKSASKTYIKQAIMIVFALFLLELLVFQVLNQDLSLTPILVSIGFALVVEISEALIWQKMEKQDDDTKATFFMAVSGFRFLLALLLIFVYYLLSESGSMFTFILLLAPCYLAVLIHHSVFFSSMNKTR